jgi:hypothetical protein
MIAHIVTRVGAATTALVATLLAGAAAGCGGEDEGVEAPIPGQRRIVSLSRSGSLSCAGQTPSNFSFSDGDFYTDLRRSLEDSRYFGPGGVVETTLVFRPTIDLVRDRSLGRADILVVNRPKIALDGAALQAIEAFVRRGGSFLSLGDDRQTFLAEAASACVADTTATVTAAGAATPIIAGPFGAVGMTYTTGYNCGFSAIRPDTAALSENDMAPNALMLDLGATVTGAGRALSFADEEAFASLIHPDCATAQLVRGGPNETLALNAFAWLAGVQR